MKHLFLTIALLAASLSQAADKNAQPAPTPAAEVKQTDVALAPMPAAPTPAQEPTVPAPQPGADVKTPDLPTDPGTAGTLIQICTAVDDYEDKLVEYVKGAVDQLIKDLADDIYQPLPADLNKLIDGLNARKNKTDFYDITKPLVVNDDANKAIAGKKFTELEPSDIQTLKSFYDRVDNRMDAILDYIKEANVFIAQATAYKQTKQ